jgi:hypothetical protein
MIFESLKRMFGMDSTSTKRRGGADDVRWGVSALRKKTKQLEKFRDACNDAGLEDVFASATQSVDMFIEKCRAFARAPENPDKISQAIVSQYNEVTSALITLANAANTAGINLHAELREMFGNVNDVMDAMGLASEASLERQAP